MFWVFRFVIALHNCCQYYEMSQFYMQALEISRVRSQCVELLVSLNYIVNTLKKDIQLLFLLDLISNKPAVNY